MPAAVVVSWRRRGDCFVLRCRDRGSGELQEVTFGCAGVGLTTKRYQSGGVDYDGHISRRGDNHLRGFLYEAAVVILTRTM